MNTKVQEFQHGTKLPAGLINGTEAVWHNNEKWLIHEGTMLPFDQAPLKLKNMIVEIFRNDLVSRKYLRKIGLTGFSKQFDTWYKCVVGGIDSTPDFLNGKLNPDAFNNSCNDLQCPHRGKLCGRSTGIKNYEVETINALKQGYSIARTADHLCVSQAGLKSRVEKMKIKLHASNMASFMSKATELGI